MTDIIDAIQDDPLRYDTGLDIYADLVRAGGEGDVPDVTKRTLANAFALYMADIGAAADVARLFYLVPPVTALMAFALFGERHDALALVGMALIAVGVAMARRR